MLVGISSGLQPKAYDSATNPSLPRTSKLRHRSAPLLGSDDQSTRRALLKMPSSS
jgi:hypothetical protein